MNTEQGIGKKVVKIEENFFAERIILKQQDEMEKGIRLCDAQVVAQLFSPFHPLLYSSPAVSFSSSHFIFLFSARGERKEIERAEKCCQAGVRT